MPADRLITTAFKYMNDDDANGGGAELIAFNAGGLAGPIAGTEGQRLGFIVSASAGAGVTIGMYEWAFEDDENDEGGPTLAIAVHEYDDPGSYTVRVRVRYDDDVTGEPQYTLEQSLQINIFPGVSGDARVWIVQPQSPHAPGEPDTRISGNAVTFVVKSTPASSPAGSPKIQYWNSSITSWTDVPFTLVSQSEPPFIIGKVDIEGLITGSTFTAGTIYFFRAVVGTVASAVDADPTTNPDQGDLQGPMRLTPVTNTGLPQPAHIKQNSNSPTVSEVQSFSSAALGFQSNLDAQVDLPYGGLDTTQATLKIAGFVSNPTGVTSGLALTGFLEVSIVGAGSLTKPLPIRIYYPDSNNDGIIDGLGVDERDLNVYHFVGTNWVRLTDITISPSGNWVESTTTGLSFFAVGAVGLPASPTEDAEADLGCGLQATRSRTSAPGPLVWSLLLLLAFAAARRWGYSPRAASSFPSKRSAATPSG